jgi:hypothetical protein
MTSGAYSTGLVSYFTHRDLFPSLMKFVQDSETHLQNLSPFVLLGLLANYNKFEFQNPYRVRLDDFVNEVTIKKVVYCVGATCAMARDKYVAVQDDLPEGWNISSTLAFIGLGALTSAAAKPAVVTLTPEEAKARFAILFVLSKPHAPTHLTLSGLVPKQHFSFRHTTLQTQINCSVIAWSCCRPKPKQAKLPLALFSP